VCGGIHTYTYVCTYLHLIYILLYDVHVIICFFFLLFFPLFSSLFFLFSANQYIYVAQARSCFECRRLWGRLRSPAAAMLFHLLCSPHTQTGGRQHHHINHLTSPHLTSPHLTSPHLPSAASITSNHSAGSPPPQQPHMYLLVVLHFHDAARTYIHGPCAYERT